MRDDDPVTTGEMLALPEDTLDLADRLDPVRAALRRAGAGDHEAARAITQRLAPRVFGLALHVTGSMRRARRVAVTALTSALLDAETLAAGALPGDVAVLDRARRMAVPLAGDGPVRSLAAESPDATERTRERGELEVMRVLLGLDPAERAVVEVAAQGRFSASGHERERQAALLADALAGLIPHGGTGDPAHDALIALDALGLADEEERERLREHTGSPEGAAAHRIGIEAAARLALLSTTPVPEDLVDEVLQAVASAADVSAEEHEAAYHGTYETPVLGTDTQQRLVGPPARAGAAAVGIADPDADSESAPSAEPSAAADASTTPRFSYGKRSEAQERRRRRRRDRAHASSTPVRARVALAVLGAAVLALAVGLALTWNRADRAEAEAAAWRSVATAPGARPVDGVSDNGTWSAVLSPVGTALHATGVAQDEETVLQLWGMRGEETIDLGVLEVQQGGAISHHSRTPVDSLLVTREWKPGNVTGTPSTMVVARLDAHG